MVRGSVYHVYGEKRVTVSGLCREKMYGQDLVSENRSRLETEEVKSPHSFGLNRRVL